MRDIPASTSLLEHLLDLNYLFASLHADEETQELAAEIEEALTKGEGLYNKRYLLQREETRKQAIVAFQDKRGDRSILETSRFSVAAHGGQRAAGHLALFPVAASKIVRLAYEKQKEAARQIIQKLEALDASHTLFSFAAKLTGYLTSFEAAQADASKAKRERALHSDEVDTWRAEVKKLRRGIFGELTALFPDDKDRVEAYFRPSGERATSVEESEESEATS